MQQPGEGPGSDSEIFGNLRITFVWSSTQHPAATIHTQHDTNCFNLKQKQHNKHIIQVQDLFSYIT